MSKIVKVLLLCTYIVLITQYIKSFIMCKSREEIIEWQYVTNFNQSAYLKLDKELKKAQARQGAMNVTIVTNIPERLPTDLKYILKFAKGFFHKLTLAKEGQDEFIDANCQNVNCFITDDKGLLFGLQYFDAILFDMENSQDSYPAVRSPHQKYVFFALGPAQEYPICNKIFDDFYNLTWTYKLDSDVTWPYMTIYNKSGAVVGPYINMTWQHPMEAIPEIVKKKLEKKSKVAAWFVSNCYTQSQRGVLFEHLEVEFRKYNMSVDVFGWCAEKQCPKDRMGQCLDLMERDYYFYLAFENSKCEDYVTEKVLHALLHYAVPIVYGGANYTRFLPPGSYINAVDKTPERVVALVVEAMRNRNTYEDYFRWHNHYVYKPADASGDVCRLCALLNAPRAGRTLRAFRRWWNPAYAASPPGRCV